MKTITLTKPIDGPDDKITAITLREPLVGDIIKMGTPFVFNNKEGTAIDAAIVGAYISRLGNVPPSTVAAIAACDYLPLMNAVVDFFTESGMDSPNSLAS